MLLCCVTVLCGAGCRKRAAEREQGESQGPAQQQQRTRHEEKIKATARSFYEEGKRFQYAGRYKDAVDAWAKAIEADKRVELLVALAKNAMVDEMIEKAHYRMHRPEENPAYSRSARELLELIVDEENGFLEKHVERANEQLAEWEWITRGWDAFHRAQRLIDDYQLAEALDLLESIRDEYAGTPLAGKAIPLLDQYGRE